MVSKDLRFIDTTKLYILVRFRNLFVIHYQLYNSSRTSQSKIKSGTRSPVLTFSAPRAKFGTGTLSKWLLIPAGRHLVWQWKWLREFPGRTMSLEILLLKLCSGSQRLHQDLLHGDQDCRLAKRIATHSQRRVWIESFAKELSFLLVLSLKSWMKHVRGSGDNLLGERQSHGGEPCIRTGDVRVQVHTWYNNGATRRRRI